LKEMDGGIPPGFWRDPYVLGFFGGTIGTLAALTSHNKLAEEDLGRVTAHTLAKLTGARGGEVVQNYLTAARELGDDFQRGSFNARKITMMSYGHNLFEDHSDVIIARYASRVLPDFDEISGEKTSENDQTVNYLAQRHFFAELKKRLGQ
jgi:hypothetical protein